MCSRGLIQRTYCKYKPVVHSTVGTGELNVDITYGGNVRGRGGRVQVHLRVFPLLPDYGEHCLWMESSGLTQRRDKMLRQNESMGLVFLTAVLIYNNNIQHVLYVSCEFTKCNALL